MKQIKNNKNINEKSYIRSLNNKISKYNQKVKVRCIMKAGKTTVGTSAFGPSSKNLRT